MITRLITIDPDKYLRELAGDTSHPDSLETRLRRLFSSQVHAANSQPLFGILARDMDTLLWTAGGQDIAAILSSGKSITTFSGLLSRLDIEAVLVDDIREQMATLPEYGEVSFAQRLDGADNRTFSIVFKRRGDTSLCGGSDAMQFTVNDISHFVAAETGVRDMSDHIMGKLNSPLDNDTSALDFLQKTRAGIETLGTLDSDVDIATLATEMIGHVNILAKASINILREFETAEPTIDHTIPTGKSAVDIPQFIPVHAHPLGDSPTITKRVSALANSGASLKADETLNLYFANTFIKNAIPVFISICQSGDIFILNGPCAGSYDSIDAMIRALGVEENSRHTANNFFASKDTQHAVLSMMGKNVELRGHMTAAGWQVMIMPSATETFDVRGLFHAFKNLILNLQVLHVVKTRDDVRTVNDGLSSTLESMDYRLNTLRTISEGGRMRYLLEEETIGQWIATVRDTVERMNGNIEIVGQEDWAALSHLSPSGVMEDSLTEIAFNALQNGAENLSVRISCEKNYLQIAIRDDGHGIAPDKLRQLRTVLETRTHDPDLTTRPDGSGQGLLGVATMMSHFIDGSVDVGKNPDGRGVEVAVSMLVPSCLQNAA